MVVRDRARTLMLHHSHISRAMFTMLLCPRMGLGPGESSYGKIPVITTLLMIWVTSGAANLRMTQNGVRMRCRTFTLFTFFTDRDRTVVVFWALWNRWMMVHRGPFISKPETYGTYEGRVGLEIDVVRFALIKY